MFWFIAGAYALTVLLLLHRPFWPFCQIDLAGVLASDAVRKVIRSDPEKTREIVAFHHVVWVLAALLGPLRLMQNTYTLVTLTKADLVDEDDDDDPVSP